MSIRTNQNSNPPGCSECRDALNHTIANNLINILSDLSKFKIYSNTEKVIRVIGSSKFKRPIFQRDATTESPIINKIDLLFYRRGLDPSLFGSIRVNSDSRGRSIVSFVFFPLLNLFFSGSWRQRLFND